MNRLRQTLIFMRDDAKRLWNWIRWKLGYEVRVPEDYSTLMAASDACDEYRCKRGDYGKHMTIRIAAGHTEPIVAGRNVSLFNLTIIGSNADRPSITIDEEKT